METLERTLYLLGNRLEDDTPETQRFRDVLVTWDAERELTTYRRWLEECLTKGSGSRSPYFRAFQDIIVTLGRRLNFGVTYGRYAARRGEPSFDGLWESPKGEIILVEIKASAWPLGSVDQLGRYMDQVAQDRELGATKVYGLYVIGYGEIAPIIEQIRGSSYSPRMRVITKDDLLELLELQEDLRSRVGEAAAEMTRDILLPLESINLGNIVHLIRDLAYPAPLEPEAHEEAPILEPKRITREEMSQLPEGDVLLCPSRPDGVDFLKTYNAWGFVRLSLTPQYVALYIAHPTRAIQFLGEVETVVEASAPQSPVRENYREFESYAPGKKVIVLKAGRLWELADIIPMGSQRGKVPQGPRLRHMSQLARARTLDDL